MTIETSRPEPLVVSVADAMHMLNISRTELYRLLSAGRINAVKQGVRTLMLVDSIRAHLAALPPAIIRVAPHRAAQVTPRSGT